MLIWLYVFSRAQGHAPFDPQEIYEVELDKIKRNLGFDIILVTSATRNEHGKALLDALGFPFRKPQEQENPEKSEAAA